MPTDRRILRKPRVAARKKRGKAMQPVMREVTEPASNAVAPPFEMPQVVVPTFPDRIVNVGEFGAVGDGAFDCTRAINQAIESAATAGGGRVVIPPGLWLSAAIHLRSNVNLHLAEGATLAFIPEPTRYLPAVFVRWNGQECYNYSPMIYARRCRNIAVTGTGRILGRGEPWWTWKKNEQQSCERLYRMVLRDIAVRDRQFASDSTPLRPQLIAPIECENVLLEDFTIAEGGPFWNVHLAYCRNVLIRRLKVDAPVGPNSNAVVIDSSESVIVEDCDLRSNDDCICLKSGMNEDGWRVDRPTQNVIVRRVRCTGGHGGITIGSEMSGGVRNVFVHDCQYDGLTAGVRMKAARGRGGIVEGVHVQDLKMGRIDGDAIQITTEYSTFTSPTGRPPTFRNISIRDVACDRARSAARLIGQSDRAIQDLRLERLTISAAEGLSCTAASGVELRDVRITPDSGPVLSVRDGQDVLIEGLHGAESASVFLDLRGRRTRNIRLRDALNGNGGNGHARPAVVLGVDVPRDALVLD